MPKRSITCTNDSNLSIVLTSAFSPWELQSCEGIYESNHTLATSDNTMTDGSTYQGSVVAQRNIVLSLRDHYSANHQYNRALLYTLFKPKSKGTFSYTENGITREIDYYVEKIYIDAIKRSRTATISLICPDPYFRDVTETQVEMAGWISGFEWQHEFDANGEEFGYRSSERIKEIVNSDAADGIGVTITLTAYGAVTTPTITHVEQGTHITIGTNDNPLTMAYGDQLIITTHPNNKHVYLVSGGTTTDANVYLTEDSTFIQLQSGLNTFGYSAVSGDENLEVDISYKFKYLGV